MKLYDKEALIILVLDLGLIVLALWSFFNRGPAIHNVAILLFSCSSLKNNITYAFSEKGSKDRKRQVQKEKSAYRNVFGRFAPLAPFSGFIMLGIGLLLLKNIKGSLLGVYVIICGMFAPFFNKIFIRDEIARMDAEKE